jgi:autotransporter-associated beta strand protein
MPACALRLPHRRALTLCILAACAAHPGTVLAGQDNGGTRQHAAGAGGAGSSSPGGGGAGGAGSYYALNFFGYGANGTGGTGNGGYNPGTNGSNGLGGTGGTAGYTTTRPSEFLNGAWNGTAGGNGSNPGSGGGGGGVGIYFVSGNQQIDATASTRGGDGGNGADDSGGGAGGGGGGGSGAALTTGAVLINYSSITGGNGGASGGSTNTETQGAGGGGGGAGVWMAPTTTFTNRGTVTGGNGGIARDTGGAGGGGAGIVSDNGGASIVNYGTVIGGLSGTGVRAHAFDLYGGNNVLALSTGTSLTGDVYAYGSSNELRLDGSGSTGSNVSGFDVVSATTNATWALNGAFLRGGSTRFEIGSGASATLAGAITGSGDVTKNGAGTLTLGGNNTYTGTTTLNAGVLALTQSNSARAPYIVNGGTLQLGSGAYNIGNLSGTGGSIVGPGVFNVQQSTAATYAGDVGVTAFQKTGAATLTLAGNVTSTQLTINTGTLQLTNNANTRVIGGNIVNQGTLAILGTAATTLSGNLSGAGNLTVGGTGPVALGGNNSYTGGTTVASGSSVRATSNSAFGSGTLALGGNNALILATNGMSIGNAITLGGATSLSVTTGQSATLSGALSGAGSIVKSGDSTLTLSGNNTYTGSTSLYGGVLALTQSNNARAAYIITGGTLQLAGTTYNLGNLTGSGGSITGAGLLSVQQSTDATYAGNVAIGTLSKTGSAWLTLSGALNADHIVIDAGALRLSDTGSARTITADVVNQGIFSVIGSVDQTLTGNLSGSGSLAFGGSGLLTISGNNSYSGSTFIDTSTHVRATSSSAFGSGLVAGAQFVLDFGADDLSVANNFSLGSGVNFNVDAGRIGMLTGAISDISGLTKTGTGTLVIDGHTTNTVTTTVDQGTLTVGSATGSAAYLAGDALVLSGATLAGHGRVDGDVTVISGGTISPGNSVGTLSLGGDLTMQSGSSLRYELGSPGADFLHTGIGDRISVGGNASFDDVTLDLIATPGFGAGVYRLFDVGGVASFTNGGLQLGTTPANSLLTLRYLAADHAIDLLNTQGAALSFWNANGLASGSTMGGGNGIWSLTSVNFTDASGSVTAPLSPQPGFAVFGGEAGTVALNSGAGDIAVTGLQIMSGGYRLTGAPLTLAGNADGLATVRVGDGSAASANVTATIDSVIEGTHGLTKTDAGTLVLTADNTWTGGVVVDGGTLSVARDANLGDTSNALTLDGGVLRNTAAFVSDRHVAVGTSGGAIDTASDLVLAQGITGSGMLHKLGAGTLLLTGTNTYTGGTSVDAGTLIVGDGAHAGSLIGPVVDNATLVFDRADDVTFDGALSGAGQLVKRGAGSFAIGDGAAFTGTTRVDAGTLDLRGTLGGSVTLGSATALTGQGAIGALVASNGSTISVAGDGTTGSLQVTGNVTLASASRYVVTVTPAGTSDLIAANGTATLQGGLIDARFSGTTVKPSTRYTILTAAGGVSGTFDSVTVDKPFLTPSLSYGAQAVYLELDRNDVDFATLATNQNAGSTATAIQSQGIGGNLFDALAVLDNADVMPALDSLTGVVYASSRSARTDDARQVRDTVQRHLDADHDGQLPGSGAWTATWGHWGDVGGNSTIGFDRSRSNGGGLLAGVDRDLNGVRVGALGGAGNLSTRSGNDSVNAKSRIAGVYASADVGAWQLSAGATYAWQRMDAHRGLDVPGLATQHASARYDGNLAQGWLDAGYRIALSGASLTPFANVARVRTQQDGFTEQQADAALVTRGTRETTTVATVGLRSSVSVGDGIDAHAKLGYQRAYGDLTPIDRQRFLDGGDTFVIQGAPLARNAGIADLGVNFVIGRHTTVGASYQGRFGGGSKDQGARLDVAVRW